jgi:hypothetical protein
MITFVSALPLAETASVFAEMILAERLLEETDPPRYLKILSYGGSASPAHILTEGDGRTVGCVVGRVASRPERRSSE